MTLQAIAQDVPLALVCLMLARLVMQVGWLLWLVLWYMLHDESE